MNADQDSWTQLLVQLVVQLDHLRVELDSQAEQAQFKGLAVGLEPQFQAATDPDAQQRRRRRALRLIPGESTPRSETNRPEGSLLRQLAGNHL